MPLNNELIELFEEIKMVLDYIINYFFIFNSLKIFFHTYNEITPSFIKFQQNPILTFITPILCNFFYRKLCVLVVYTNILGLKIDFF